VEGEVHGGVQLRDGFCQAGRLHSGERARTSVDLGTLIAASTALYQTYISNPLSGSTALPYACFKNFETLHLESLFYCWEVSPVEINIS
jgi:hypothetical protein